ncbi:hypothetical protein [Hoyosella altamirensis]|uniref:Metal-responsive CopG/Arc/MetJ family transcriptional regulator n=1 Tax=Hoyosella altamirensis TaxID=616997 RepID=A0A839RKK9_9ACTN|nr:hypothetical protein [Hoyosella altamirensis]MBB3036839.1 metal-responsive CopG/Arc/MetJ family transcriptional regulator [Hoyosella altamirensis]
MKFLVTLPRDDVRTLDDYVRRTGLESRNDGLRAAIQALRDNRLEDAYRVALESWSDANDAAVWELAIADGLSQ